MYFDLNRIIYFNIFFMVNLLKVKTIRNFINVVKIGIVLFKYCLLYTSDAADEL